MALGRSIRFEISLYFFDVKIFNFQSFYSCPHVAFCRFLKYHFIYRYSIGLSIFSRDFHVHVAPLHDLGVSQERESNTFQANALDLRRALHNAAFHCRCASRTASTARARDTAAPPNAN